jgi:hypothetical protein
MDAIIVEFGQRVERRTHAGGNGGGAILAGGRAARAVKLGQ